MIDKNRFIKLWSDLALPGAKANAESAFDVLDQLYRESGRYYHNWAHIDQFLRDFDAVRQQCYNPNAVELAIWFHDAVFEEGARDNERRSADLFLELSEGVLDERIRRHVDELIMVTLHGRHLPELHDGQLLADIDLLSFGSDQERFWRDNKNVRLESSVSDDEFYPKQIMFMRLLLQREKLYASDYFHQRYEDHARRTITAYIDDLNERGFYAPTPPSASLLQQRTGSDRH